MKYFFIIALLSGILVSCSSQGDKEPNEVSQQTNTVVNKISQEDLLSQDNSIQNTQESQEDLLSQDNSIQNTQESQEDLLSQDNSIQNTQESQESGAKEDLQTQREEILEISTQYFRSSNQQLIAEEMPQESQGDYVFYNSELIGSTQDTVIFFHASWCASCRAAEEGILAGKIPDTLTILKANFDSELELRKKYGIVAQHTFVSVDSSGDLISKWVGGTSIEAIMNRL